HPARAGSVVRVKSAQRMENEVLMMSSRGEGEAGSEEPLAPPLDTGRRSMSQTFSWCPCGWAPRPGDRPSPSVVRREPREDRRAITLVLSPFVPEGEERLFRELPRPPAITLRFPQRLRQRKRRPRELCRRARASAPALEGPLQERRGALGRLQRE